MSNDTQLLTVLLGLLLPATYYDVREFRIPNWLTLLGCGAGLAFSFWLGGPHQLGVSALALLAAFACTFPFWMFGWAGAGDVKLLAAVGAFVGMPLIFSVLALTAFSGLLLALVALARRGLMLKALSRIASTIGITLAAKTPVYLRPDEEESSVKLPYAVAIAVGSIAAVLLFA